MFHGRDGTINNPAGRRAAVDIVGCGAVTQQFHVAALRWLERRGFAAVRYCLDRDFQAASSVASRFHGARPIQVSSPTGFDASGAALALVATPPDHHCEWARHYLEAGGDVLVEKPAVLTMREFALLSNEARVRGRAVLAGHVRRFFPSVRAARDAIKAGEIGPIRRIDAYEGVRGGWTTQTDFPVTSKSGGVLHAIGSHVLDMVLFMCGLDASASAPVRPEVLEVARWPDTEPSHEVRALLALQTHNSRLPVALRLSRREPLANVVRVFGDRGELLVETWYGTAALLRTDGTSRWLPGELHSPVAVSIQGCFVAEHLEMWRVWAEGERTSPILLDRFGLLTQTLEMLVAGQ